MFKDCIILITGGTSSFGNAVFHRFFEYGNKRYKNNWS